MAFKGGVVLGTISFNATGSGTTNIGATSNSGTISIGNTSSGAIAIDCGTAGITVGTTANAHATTVGSTNSTSATTVQSGSGALNITSTNGALTINSGTGTLGISTDASANTVNVATGAAVKTATFGSTNTTSSTAIKSGSGNVNINSGFKVDSSGRNLNAVQPCFFAYRSSTVNDVTGDGTLYTVIFNSVASPGFDQGSNFNTTTGTFTAPVAGKYFLSFNITLSGLLVAHIDCQSLLVTTGVTIACNTFNPIAIAVSGTTIFGFSTIVSMAVNDTAVVKFVVSGGTKVVDVVSSSGVPQSNFSGYLLC